jgi:DNA-3-methyladenine glycosylase II
MRHSSALIHNTITEETLARGLQFLSERDRDLAIILKELGPPPMWFREPGFPTLIHIILEQQVSLASARAAFQRLLAVAKPLTPHNFLLLDDGSLNAMGFSRQKIIYGRHLSTSIIEGQLDPDGLGALDDAEARAELLKIKGIGHWTADIYLLMALRRQDIWPIGDLALAVAVQRIKRLPARPSPLELESVSLPWRPWRAVAARLLWHYYLSGPKTSGKLPRRTAQ